MSDNQFQPGDVVRLKSGSPNMTVKSVGNDWGGELSVFVTWFDDKHKPMDGSYPVATVQKVRD
jgi:uncharacterized protein YodC (DUF2158 family)